MEILTQEPRHGYTQRCADHLATTTGKDQTFNKVVSRWFDEMMKCRWLDELKNSRCASEQGRKTYTHKREGENRKNQYHIYSWTGTYNPCESTPHNDDFPSTTMRWLFVQLFQKTSENVTVPWIWGFCDKTTYFSKFFKKIVPTHYKILSTLKVY